MSEAPVKLMPSDLAALMCARICHDLISPVGALGTALEVLDDEENADMHADALDLVRLSAGQASAKLQFLRLAFGAGGSAPGVIGIEKLKELTDGVYGEGKAEIRWETAVDGLEKVCARLLLNLIMIGVQTIPRGGTLTIHADDGPEGVKLRLTANGPKARLDENFVKSLSGRAPEGGFDGRSVQAFYAGLIARERKARISAGIDDETVRIGAVFPPAPSEEAA